MTYGQYKDCDEHENNHFIGGCISCTYAEYRRYKARYEDAMGLLGGLQDHRSREVALAADVDRQLNRWAKDLAN